MLTPYKLALALSSGKAYCLGMTDDEVVAMLAEACDGGVTKWADAHKVSAQYVSDVLHGRRTPGKKILDALSLEKIVTFRKKRGAEQRTNHTKSLSRKDGVDD